MARAIFYTHHTSGECVGVCACDCTHKIKKTDIYIKASYELQLNFLYRVLRKTFSSSVCFTRDNSFYSLDGDVLTRKRRSGSI